MKSPHTSATVYGSGKAGWAVKTAIERAATGSATKPSDVKERTLKKADSLEAGSCAGIQRKLMTEFDGMEEDRMQVTTGQAELVPAATDE